MNIYMRGKVRRGELGWLYMANGTGKEGNTWNDFYDYYLRNTR